MGRIISYSEKTGYNDGDYLVLDNAEGGTKRIRADRVGIQLDPTLTQAGQAADAAASGAIARAFLALGLRAGDDGRIIQRLPAEG